MDNLETRKIQKYLNNLVDDSVKRTLSSDDMIPFKDKLETCLSKMRGEIIEYERSSRILRCMSKWEVSERSPLKYQKVGKLDDDFTVFFMCDTQPKWHSGRYKYFNPISSQVSFLKNGGLYLAILTPGKIVHEDIYLPKELVQQIR